jgi:hypothetical protein
MAEYSYSLFVKSGRYENGFPNKEVVLSFDKAKSYEKWQKSSAEAVQKFRFLAGGTLPSGARSLPTPIKHQFDQADWFRNGSGRPLGLHGIASY